LVLLAPVLPEKVRLVFVDIKAFLDSLFKGNPVAIILLWRSRNPENPLSSGSSSARVRARVESSENYLIVDGQQRVLSLLLLLNGWHVKIGDMEYAREPISFNPTKYVLEVSRRGLDLSEGMRVHLSLEGVDSLKRKHASEYVDKLLGLCERIPENIILQDPCLLHGPER
jgi:hypothetical protein